ncbi:MAG: enoyl-CoA hydratase/isomerase family protein [Flavobacteriales bacterium]|nr:enoyl-CoA hydratase/isomerase family protein [Flavobacteriales bacterium]MBL4734366.1 enoyl-CoA hydratase/isomerase family protein [Flavobacteriales bacterium]
MDYTSILSEQDNGIVTITINRPEKLNALNKATLTELDAAVASALKDSSVAGIIITGAGEKAFVAGADISEFTGISVEEGKALSQNGQDIFERIEKGSKPVIAAVNGFALGGGCELAMACHIRVASENALFGQPEVNLGLIPGYGGTQRMIQLIGKGKATELLMTADMVKAPEALNLGLVNHVTSSEELLPKCVEILEKIKGKSPIAIGKIINCVNAHFEDGTNGFDVEVNQFSKCVATEDFKEGTSAFLEKRKANFPGK